MRRKLVLIGLAIVLVIGRLLASSTGNSIGRALPAYQTQALARVVLFFGYRRD
jgi:hypothetical protein